MSGSGRLSLFSANRRRYFRVVLPAKLGLIGLILLFSLSAGKNDEDMVPMSNQASKVEQSSDTTYKLHPKIITIDSLVRIDNLSAAISTYKQLISNKTDLPIGGHIYVGNVIGNNLNRLRQFDSTLTWLDTSYSLEKARPIDTLLLALQYYIRGVAYNFLNKPDSSEKYHHKALYLRTNHSTQITEDLVSSYMGLGNIKRYLIHDYDSASIYYELATQTLTNQTGEPNKGLLFRCQYNLAATYYRRGNRDKAIFFCKEALRNAEEIGRPIFITFSLDLLRNIYVNYEDFENTEIYARKLIKMYDAGQMENYRILAWSHINVAISQTEKLEYDSALISLNKAHEITKNELSGDSRTLSSIYEEIGVTHNDAKNYDEALAHYHKSLSLKSDEVPGNFTTIYKLLGQFHLDRQQNDSALYYLQKSLHSLTSEFPESDYARVPLADSIPQNNQIVDLIRYKALTLSRIAESEDQYDNLLLAKANYLLGDSIISINRSHDLLESEELWMANDIQDYYAEALRCIYKLSLIKEHQPDYNVALRFIDQNKAQIMLRSLKESLFLESNGAHDSLVQYNKDVNAELAHWKNSKEIQTDEESRIEIEKKIFQLISKKKEIDKLINSTYDDFQNTFHAKSLTIDQLANITESDSTLILAYYQANKEIYCLSFGRGKVRLDQINIDSTFMDHFTRYNQNLSDANPFDQQHFEDYVVTANYLFQKIVPVNSTDYKSLTIIPDGLLTKVPFEALLTSKIDVDKVNYAGLPYLIKELQINYHQNTFSLLEQEQLSTSKRKVKLGGWAYEEIPGQQKLPMAVQEVENISERYDKTLFKGPGATRESFVNSAAQYDVLHLAIHGNERSESNNSPCLQFYPTSNDGLLHAYEINKMSLSASMVVLSACKTGVGTLEEGEGMFSMARSFFYVGCPSVVLSLWNLKDDSGSEIISSYYDHLKRGLAKDVSMRSAKLNYISNKDQYLSHPSYWAGTILIGNNSPLWDDQWSLVTLPLPLIIGLVVMSLLAFYLFRKQRLKHSHK